MGNAKSSSQFPPPSNNDNGGNSSDEEEGTTAPSALKIGAVVAGSALLALGGAYAMAKKKVTQMHDLEPEGFGGGGGGNNHRGHGTCAGYPNQSSASQTIKIMSYNVWLHEDVEVVERMYAIGQLVRKHGPDLIFFQEVTKNIYKLFEGSDWWGEYECCLDPPEGAPARSDFCMLLSKLPVMQFLCDPHGNSNVGKGMCAAEIDVDARRNLVVATTHLMKPNGDANRGERRAQATAALRRLNSVPNIVVGGDMNWNDESDGPFPMLDGWQDAWSVLRPGEKGWTFDTRSNPMLDGRSSVQKRLDRFMFKLQDFRVASVDMIGMDAIRGISYYNNKGEELPVLPSDHYGLVLTIRPVQNIEC